MSLYTAVCPRDPEEESWTNYLRANPDDRTAKLVFADWLEERGGAFVPLAQITRFFALNPSWSPGASSGRTAR
ncbi:hypothetical protein VT84_13555 [Gemmata sp. SH-PL17]|uniref:TIGR02996 domain-containing protein n=1 Tax=Gemmata sp. SH-PL17 TaxID=1630693 RepID=UPI00078E7C6A|nr:hypothetical protein VT84_13555 [Gemmata sp. SH-PL17]